MGLNYTNPPLSPLGQGMLNRPPTVPIPLPQRAIIPPPSIARSVGALGLVGALVGVVEIIGELGANRWRDELLGKITGARKTGESPLPNRSDLDGLPTNRLYEALRNDNQWVRPNDQSYTVEQLKELIFYPNDATAIANGHTLANGVTVLTYFKAVRPIGGVSAIQFSSGDPVGTGFATPLGLDFGDSKTKSPPPAAKPITPPIFSPAVGWGNGKPVTNGVGAGLGIGSQSTGIKTAPPPTTTPPPPVKTPPPTKEEEKKKEEQKKTEEEKKKEEQKKREEEQKKAPPPPSKDLNDILLKLGTIIGFTELIRTNTQPDAQRQNSKNGACDALNSPSCTQNLKNDIVNPLNQNIDATKVQTSAILGNQALQNAAISSVAGKVDNVANKADSIFDRVGNLWNNTLIDKAVNYLTLITVIHNAAMLSRGIADTLGSAIDSGLQALGLNIKDKDGNQLGVGQVIGKTTENIIKSVIGAENYTALNATWAQANRIYQASINLVSNVQNILDSTTAVAELTSNRVALLMNGLRNSGMVREDAYTSQTPNTTRVNAFMQKLENLEQSTSNAAMITGNISSVQQSVNELKQNRTEFENAVRDKNTQEESSKTEKREESIFKINDFSITRAEEVLE